MSGRRRSGKEFTAAQEAEIERWRVACQLPNFTAALHDLVARGLGQ